MTEPHQGHAIGRMGGGGFGQTHPRPIYTNVIFPAPLTQGDQAHNSRSTQDDSDGLAAADTHTCKTRQKYSERAHLTNQHGYK